MPTAALVTIPCASPPGILAKVDGPATWCQREFQAIPNTGQAPWPLLPLGWLVIPNGGHAGLSVYFCRWHCLSLYAQLRARSGDVPSLARPR